MQKENCFIELAERIKEIQNTPFLTNLEKLELKDKASIEVLKKFIAHSNIDSK